MKIHNVFHVFLLEPGRSRDGTEMAPPPVIINDKEEYEVEEILDSRYHYEKIQYLVKWLGYPPSDNQRAPAGDVAQSQDLLDLFHKIYPDKPSSLVKNHRGKRETLRVSDLG